MFSFPRPGRTYQRGNQLADFSDLHDLIVHQRPGPFIWWMRFVSARELRDDRYEARAWKAFHQLSTLRLVPASIFYSDCICFHDCTSTNAAGTHSTDDLTWQTTSPGSPTRTRLYTAAPTASGGMPTCPSGVRGSSGVFLPGGPRSKLPGPKR